MNGEWVNSKEKLIVIPLNNTTFLFPALFLFYQIDTSKRSQFTDMLRRVYVRKRNMGEEEDKEEKEEEVELAVE